MSYNRNHAAVIIVLCLSSFASERLVFELLYVYNCFLCYSI